MTSPSGTATKEGRNMSNTKIHALDNGKKIVLADDVYSFGRGVVVGGPFDPRCPIGCYFCQRGLIGGGCGLKPPAGKRLCLMMKNGELLEHVRIGECTLMSDEDEHVFDVEMKITHKTENSSLTSENDEERQLMGSEMYGFGWYREEIQWQRHNLVR